MKTFVYVFVLMLIAGGNALVYPIEEEFLAEGDMLIPALPRPMTTKADSPFHIFAKRTPIISVTSAINPEDMLLADKHASKLILVVFSANTEMEIPFAFLYGFRIRTSSDIMPDMCGSLELQKFKEISSGITSLSTAVFKVSEGPRDTKFLSANITLEKSGYQYAFVLNCNKDDITLSKGSLVFRNPHGYLPGGWYLKLPFSVFVLIGYVVAILIFGIKCLLHSEQIMFVQYGVLIVLVMGLLEQAINYITFFIINSYGELPCCPVKPDMALTMIVSAMKRATFVTFLLFVSLGYGIQRPSLRRKEYTAIAIMGILYLVAAVNYELAVISEIDSTGGEDDSSSAQPSTVLSSMILSVLNVVVVYWIYMSLVRVIESLEEQKQDAKKNMYENLVRSIIIWFIVGFLAEGFFYGWLTHKVATPWKYDMVPKFIWDILFFMVVIQVGWLWLPNNNSRQFAYAQELPTDDFDDLDDDDTEYEIEFDNLKRKNDGTEANDESDEEF